MEVDFDDFCCKKLVCYLELMKFLIVVFIFLFKFGEVLMFILFFILYILFMLIVINYGFGFNGGRKGFFFFFN